MAASAEEVSQRRRVEMSEDYRAIIDRLQDEADDRVTRRHPIEQRWIEDLTQYHGQHNEKVAGNLRKAKKSSLFINQTRPKTNAMEARLSDMLFPTDDQNWGIGPTPVPELTVDAELAAEEAAATKLAAVENPEDAQLQAEAQQATQNLKMIKKRADEARKRSRYMEEEIADHLNECKYPAQARDVIRDACRIGTGVIKGPVTDGRSRRSWAQQEEDVPDPSDPTGQRTVRQKSNVFQIQRAPDAKPAFWRTDPWNFFPDLDVPDVEDGEGTYERHLLNKKQLRKLAKLPGFDKAAIRRLIIADPTESAPAYLPQLRSITSDYNDQSGDRYHVWEAYVTLTYEDLEIAAEFAPGASAIFDELPEAMDPLDEVSVVAWFCQGELLKIGEHHLDSCESVYSVFNLEKDEVSPFGFGIPYLMRHSQSALGAAWRALMDNMGLTAGPQIVVDQTCMQPQDGNWELTPNKIWLRTSSSAPNKRPFEVFNIDSHMNDLLAIIDVAKKNIDEETALPIIAQGDQSTQITKTAGGMSMLMNSVNIVFRRVVKNWDDDITAPCITRIYDWLMQFSPKEHIKGDYQVDARGTSVLLVREMQSANLLSFLIHFGNHPTLTKYLKKDGLPALRRLAQVLMIPADEIIKTDDEVAEDDAKAADLPPPPNPEMEKIAAELNLEKLRGRNALVLEGARRETALITLASKQNMEVEKLKAMLFEKREDRTSRERIIATEAAVESRNAKRAAATADKDRIVKANGKSGKSGKKPAKKAAGGSGGYFSTPVAATA